MLILFLTFPYFQRPHSHLCIQVLSHNKIAVLPSFPRLTDLVKLSATHNSITEIPDLSFNTKLKELRLSHNNIKTLPESLKECVALEVFEVGHNEIENWR